MTITHTYRGSWEPNLDRQKSRMAACHRRCLLRLLQLREAETRAA